MVTLFAFYPSSRHNIAINYPNAIWGSPCSIVTFALSTAAWLLLSSSFERYLFAMVQSTVLVVSPILMWRLQMRKRTISGPWDVGPQSSATTMGERSPPLTTTVRTDVEDGGRGGGGRRDPGERHVVIDDLDDDAYDDTFARPPPFVVGGRGARAGIRQRGRRHRNKGIGDLPARGGNNEE